METEMAKVIGGSVKFCADFPLLNISRYESEENIEKCLQSQFQLDNII